MIFKFSQVDIPIQQSYLWYGSSEGDSDPQVCNFFAHTTNSNNIKLVQLQCMLQWCDVISAIGFWCIYISAKRIPPKYRFKISKFHL